MSQPQFTLDDVRDYFAPDTDRLLGGMEAALAGLPSVDDPWPAAVLRPALRAINDNAHTLYGVAALVHVDSLAGTARLLQRLARAGAALADPTPAQRLSWRTCTGEAVSAARAMVDLELAGRKAEADSLATDVLAESRPWVGEVEDPMASPGDLPPSAGGSDGSAVFRSPPPLQSGAVPGSEVPDGTSDPLAGAFESVAVSLPAGIPAVPDEGGFEFADPAPASPAGSPVAPGTGTNPAVPSGTTGAVPSGSSGAADRAERAERVVLQRPPGAPPPPVSAPAIPEDIDPELLGIFRDEAREAMVALQGHLRTLLKSPSDRPAAEGLARIYHTLKGSAAAVGLEVISRSAAEMMNEVEERLEAAASVPVELLEILAEQTDRLYADAGLAFPPVLSTVTAGAGGAAGKAGTRSGDEGGKSLAGQSRSSLMQSGELKGLFAAELGETVAQADPLLEQLGSSDPGRRTAARRGLAGLLHRLKGSATLCGENDIALSAESGRALAESTADDAEVRRSATMLLRRLAARVVAGGNAPGGTPVKPGGAAAIPVPSATSPAAASLVGSGATGKAGKPSPAGPAGPGKSTAGSADKPAARPAPAREAAAELVREAVALDMDAELAEAFDAECAETMEAIERGGLALEHAPQPKAVLAELMRHTHTLKGAVNTVGLTPTGKILHRVEDLLESLGESPVLPPMRRLSQFLLRVLDGVRANLETSRQGWVETSPSRLERDIAGLAAGGAGTSEGTGEGALPGPGAGSQGPDASRGPDGSADSGRFGARAGADAGSAGSGASRTSGEAGQAADAVGSAGSRPSGGPAGSDARSDPRSDARSDAQSGARSSLRGAETGASAGRATGASLHGDAGAAARQEGVRVSAQRLDTLMNLAGELMVGRARMLHRLTAVRSLQRELQDDRDKLVGSVEEFRRRHEFGLAGGRGAPRLPGTGHADTGHSDTARPGPGKDADSGADETAVEPAARAGRLFGELELDTYDDLNILARRLAELAADISEIQSQADAVVGLLGEDFELFSRLLSDLRSELTRARMVPVEQLFLRLRRPVADAAARLDKNVRVAVAGEDVDLDRTIVDRLYLPMLHLVRNCVAHGVESPETRHTSGKDPVGTITLTAVQESGRAVIEVTDDGAGLNLRGLKERAVRRGLLAAGAEVPDAVLADLIFQPGMSTSDGVGDVSGRGLGGAIIRQEVQKLGGSIEVRTSPGQGTRFTIVLPMTLAIRRAMLLRAGGETYAVALHFAERIVDLAESRVYESAGVRRIEVGGELLPLRSLTGLLGLGEPEAAAPSGSPADDAAGPGFGSAGRGDGEGGAGADSSGEPSPASLTDPFAFSETDRFGASAGGAGAAGGASGFLPAAGVSGRSRGLRGAGVVLMLGDRRLALQVDRVLGQEEIVVKQFGDLLAGHPLLAGATLGGDGEIILILDPAGLMDAAGDTATITAHGSTGTGADGGVGGPRLGLKVLDTPEASLPPVSRPARSGQAGPAGGDGPLRVLFADDSLSVRKVAENFLRGSGIDVTVAVDGRDALEKLREGRFDVLFTDLEMPRLNGYELLREVRRNPATARLPVVVVTSRSGEKHRRQAKSLGADDYLTKPFTAEVLAGTARRLAASRAKAAAGV